VASKIRFRIQAKNVGPHINLDQSFDTGSLQLGLFANNGSGKTFLSRLFRYISKSNPVAEDANKLLTLNQSEGSFEFSVTDIAQNKNTLVSLFNINLKRNHLPVINTGQNKYIFHVFNDDYIKENLEELRYKPNGNIEGYILGKEKIDISKEKNDLNTLEHRLEELENSIIHSINEAKKELENLGIRNNTKEFSLLTYNNFFKEDSSNLEIENFESLTSKLDILKLTPDNLPDLGISTSKLDSFKLLHVQEYLESKFSKSNIAEDFKLKIRLKQGFIESGLKIIGSQKETCPFCEQNLIESSLNLIDSYNAYLEDSEAKHIKQADILIDFLALLEDEVYKIYNEHLKLNVKYNDYKKYLPSVSNDLEIIDPITDFAKNIDFLKTLLQNKKDNIALTYNVGDFGISRDYISNYIQEIIKTNNINKSLLDIINKKKNNIQSEKLDLNRRLIRCKYKYIKNNLTNTIKDVVNTKKEIIRLTEDIDKKEQNEKIARKSKVFESLNLYLNQFFGEKYSIDKETFCIKFQNNLLANNASDVLSEGEKSIMAFCYYLSDIHNYIYKEKDYSKLFLVIDDPISSLDFHYVYSVTNVIRNFGRIFKIEPVRFFILTHNLEFMSLLIRNKIINYKYILTPGNIEELRKELVVPYEEHLRDVYEVSIGQKIPSHTTPNSIRHILETVNRFIAPHLELQSFCQSINTLDECDFLYTLIQDNSHGNIRLQKPYTNESIIKGCKTVISYIGLSFEGQLKNL
jgi:wobble nucleotide-excising tRNase